MRPKFPHPTTIDRLLRHWRDTANGSEPDIEALYMASLTLTRMADGGLFDHVGGGFCRYSVDRYWQIPHFEKMLYDNGPLLALYAQAFLATGEAEFAATASATADWMLADMRSPDGSFYATRDADSARARKAFTTSGSPDEPSGTLIGDDDLRGFRQLDSGSTSLPISKGQLAPHGPQTPKRGRGHAAGLSTDVAAEAKSRRAKATLLDARAKRVAPGRDEKQLTAWNALAIRGLVMAGRALERDDLIEAAVGAVNFIRDRLLVVDGRLLANYKDGEARFAAYLDDYAFLLDALLELLQARWSSDYLELARRQSRTRCSSTSKTTEDGGFFFTANDHEDLIHRQKPLADESVPAGNGIAAFALQRLGFLLGETRYLDAAERTLRVAWRALEEYPHGHVSLLTTLEEYLAHTEIIVIRGEDNEIRRWSEAAAKVYAPRRLVYAIPADATGLPGALAERAPRDGGTVAYRCLGTHCELPVTSWEALAANLAA